MADLVRKVNRDMEVELDFIKLSSYEGILIPECRSIVNWNREGSERNQGGYQG
jgi:hypoxanthine-guanine phosphoribosyltransferase